MQHCRTCASETQGKLDGSAPRPRGHQVRAALPFLVPLVVALLFCAVYAPLASLPGPDVPYYYLGVEHLQEGGWPWHSEPPLSFLVLWPLTRLFGDHLAFVLLGAASVAVTAGTCGLIAAAAYEQQTGPAQRSAAGLLAVTTTAGALAMVYATPQFANCLLKNNLSNALMVLAILAWARNRPRLAGITMGLAVLSHPGAVVPLLVAMGLYLIGTLTRGGGRLGRPGLGPGPEISSGQGRQRTLSLLLGAATVAAAWPTLARYAATYFSSQQLTQPPFGAWMLDTMLWRYLPLWLGLAGLGLQYLKGRPCRPVQPVLRLNLLWILALVGLSVVGGPVGRRLEIQMFIPLSIATAGVLSPPLLRPEVGTGRGRSWRALRAPLALGFGLIMLLTSLHPRPLVDHHESQALRDLGHQLPPQSKLVTYGTNAVYWVEYLTGVPVISPNRLPWRGQQPGPTYLLTEQSPVGARTWPAAVWELLAQQDRLVWQAGRFAVIRVDDDLEFFASWPREPHRSSLTLLQMDEQLWPEPVAPVVAGPATRLAGWLLFWPTGLLLAAGISRSLAAGGGLLLTYLLLESAQSWLRRRPGGRRSPTVGAQHDPDGLGQHPQVVG